MLQKGTIVGPYVGTFFDAETQSRHKAESVVGAHRLTLRTCRASMPPSVAGIVGCIQHALVDGTRHGLD